MLFLPILLVICVTSTSKDNIVARQDRLALSIIADRPFQGERGYYFSLASAPLSENQHVFVATPLKKAFFIVDGQMIVASHTMTIKGRKGFTDYFSADKHHAILMIREESRSGTITDYRGTLEIRHGLESRKFKVYGRLYQ